LWRVQHLTISLRPAFHFTSGASFSIRHSRTSFPTIQLIRANKHHLSQSDAVASPFHSYSHTFVVLGSLSQFQSWDSHQCSGSAAAGTVSILLGHTSVSPHGNSFELADHRPIIRITAAIHSTYK
jgi:hypothetical protein